jgi:glucose/arabinose dehydrogenase
MIRYPACALGALLLVVSGLLASDAAADDKAEKTAFDCPWADGPIQIDGKADEDAWKAAQPIDNFYLPWLQEKSRPAKTATRARLLWDRENLYFFADMDDGDLYADIEEHDGTTWENDVFELFFKPADDKPGYYEFQVSAAGTVMDMFLPRRGAGGFRRFIKDGDFAIESKVALRGTLNKWTDEDKGWSVEGRIPWTGFGRTGGRPEPNEVWKFTLCRYDYSVDFEGPELSTCAPLNTKSHPDFHAFEGYASLKFLPPDKAAGVPKELGQPLTTSKVVGSPDPPLPYRPVRAFPDLKLTFPIAIDRIPGSDQLLLIAQDRSYGPASVLRIADQTNVAKAELLMEVPGGGTAYGMCFHPKFAQNGYMYLGWNGALEKGAPKETFVTRYTLDREKFTVDPASAMHIIHWESDGHNGGDLEFGLDGMLYVTSGDGTSDSDTNLRGQELTHLTAKLLRIDVDRPGKDKDGNERPYSVPADNPFVGLDGIAPETWAYGFRNPWRIAVDPQQGHIWVGNNGQDLWEQVFFVRKGDNFGWSVYEGSHIFYAERKLGPHPHVLPAAEHHHSEARSLTGGVVYYGTKLPELVGAYIYGDHSTGKIWGMKHDGDKVVWHKLLADTTFNISGFGIDSRGELLVADHRGNNEGAYYYLEPTPPVTTPNTFPRKLSESGLFLDVARHAMQPGVVPYSVNSPLWSDGAHKERFIAIPHKEGVDMRIGFATSRGWNFPDETVLVKSFALETVAGDPSSRRWIETRFLTRQAGEWVGYSYIWNDEQTDAELVPAEGLDREYEIRVPKSGDNADGLTRQKWRYPSRTECMVCHSRAANFVLGPTEMQMNREHDYGGVKMNQLEMLERLGMLKANAQADAENFLKEDLKKAGLDEKQVAGRLAELSAARNQRTAKGESSLLGGPAARYKRLPDPYSDSEPLEARVRSYLHVNCSSCHVEAGGGNAQMQLEFATELAKMGVVDSPPLHHKFGIEDARIVAPGHPERSVLLHRLSHRGQGTGQMPQLGTNVVDEAAVKMVREWIAGLKPLPKDTQAAAK